MTETNPQDKAIPQVVGGTLIQFGMTVADRYGPTGVLVLALLVGMWYTTAWLRDEAVRNDQNSLVMQANYSTTLKEQRDVFVTTLKEQRTYFDSTLDRQHKQFTTSMESVTRTFNEVMLRERRSGGGLEK